MSNPFGQISAVSKEITSDPAKVGTIPALVLKFMVAALLVFIAFVYADKKSGMNGNSVEENMKLYKYGYKPKEDDDGGDEKKEGSVGSSSGVSKN